MGRGRRTVAGAAALLVAVSTLVGTSAGPVAADTTPQVLPLTQDWSNDAAIQVDDNWSGVPGIIGYRGDGLTTTGVDPQTVLADGATTPVDVNANQTNPDTFVTGGVAEFRLTDPVIALQGSGTADAPHLVATFATNGVTGIRVQYDARDIDSASGVTQQLALQFRVGTSGNYTNVTDGFIADATADGATKSTHVDATLPAAADDQPVVQVRILTTDAPLSDEWIGIDNLSITSTGVVTGPADPAATCPSTLAAFVGLSASAPVSATDADSAFASVAITSPPVAGIDLTPGADASTATLSVAGSTAVGTYPVTITFTTDDATPQTAACDVVVTVAGATPIHDVQGRGAASPVVGDQVLVEGVVTAAITRSDRLDGFFIQAPDAAADDDASTSEGVYVFCATTCPPPPGVTAGDAVRAIGRVEEFNGTTEIVTGPGGIEVDQNAGPLPTATPVALPAAAPTSADGTFERYEGMLTTFPDTLTVSELFQQAQFGELELMAGGRPFTFTQLTAPSKTGNDEFLAALSLRRLVLDDASDDSNDPIVGATDEAYFFPTPGLAAGNRVRAGDTVADLTGVMQFAFGQWRLRPVAGYEYTFIAANAWPSTAPDVAGRLRLAGFNVLNYFATIDTTPETNVGPCSPLGTMDCRGADSEAERVAQLAKIVASLTSIDADVVGLTEIENDTGRATQQIVDALNAATAPGTYDYIRTPTPTIGTDAIKVAFLYKPGTVKPIGTTRVLTSVDKPAFIDTLNRPPIIQTFREVSTGEVFTAAINHLKSKGSACAGDPDQGDGAGNCNLTRKAAAQAEAEFLATGPTGVKDPDIIVLGDLNAYRMEDPVRVFEQAGYTNLVHRFVGEDAYSFLFDGMIGYLDHALANPSMNAQVVDTDEWHSNADENPLFDYSDTIFDAGERSFERKSAALPLLVLDPRRASDHDPVIVGIDLASLRVDAAVVIQAPRGGGSVVMSGSVGAPSTTCPSLEVRVGDAIVKVGPTTRVPRTNACVSLTTKGLVTYDLSTGAFAAALGLPGFRLPSSEQLTIGLTVDGTSHAVVRDGRRAGLVWVAS